MISDKDIERYLGESFSSIKSPELLAYDASLDFAASVGKILQYKKMTLKQLSSLLGVRPSTVSEKLNGKTNLTLKSIAEIADALDCEFTSPILKLKNECIASYSKVETKTSTVKNCEIVPFSTWSDEVNKKSTSTIKIEEGEGDVCYG